MRTSTAGQGSQVHVLVLLEWSIHEPQVISSFLITDQETKAVLQIITKKEQSQPSFSHSVMPI